MRQESVAHILMKQDSAHKSVVKALEKRITELEDLLERTNACLTGFDVPADDEGFVTEYTCTNGELVQQVRDVVKEIRRRKDMETCTYESLSGSRGVETGM